MTTATATRGAVHKYNHSQKGKMRKRLYRRRQTGIKTKKSKPRKFKFGYLYKVSGEKLSWLAPNVAQKGATKNIYLTPYSSASKKETGKCALVELRGDRIIVKDPSIEKVDVRWASIGICSSHTMRFAVERLINSFPAEMSEAQYDEYDIFKTEHEGLAQILEEQEAETAAA